MASTEERLTALERAVSKLAANKLDIVDFQAIQALNIQRYVDLHTAYVNINEDIVSIQLWATNHQTGNTI